MKLIKTRLISSMGDETIENKINSSKIRQDIKNWSADLEKYFHKWLELFSKKMKIILNGLAY